MKSLVIFALSAWAGLSPCMASQPSTPKSIEREQIEFLSARQYCALLLAASRAGRKYSLDERRSGLKKHRSETELRFLQQGYTILDGGRRPRRLTLARDERAARILWHHLYECFGRQSVSNESRPALPGYLTAANQVSSRPHSLDASA